MTRTFTKYHTSHKDIQEPHDKGRFGKGIFFSDEPYYMYQGDNSSLYSAEINSDDIIDASSLAYTDEYDKIKPIVKKIMKQFKVDEETALDLLSGSTDPYDLIDEGGDYEDVGEQAWDLQKLALDAASLLGYKGVNLKDETGISTLMDIFHIHPKMRKL